MKIFNISTKVYIGVFLIISLLLVSYKTMMVYTYKGALINRSLVEDIKLEGFEIFGKKIDKNLKNDLNNMYEVLTKNKVFSGDEVIKKIGLQYESHGGTSGNYMNIISTNSDYDKNRVSRVVMEIIEPVNKYYYPGDIFIRKNLNDKRAHININSGHRVIKGKDVYTTKKDLPVKLLANILDTNTKIISFENISQISITLDSEIKQVSSVIAFRKSGRFSNYLEYKNGDIKNIENIKTYKVLDKSTIAYMYISYQKEGGRSAKGYQIVIN